MQKQNSESGDSTIDISAIKDDIKLALKSLEYNPCFQRILESQANFEIENEEEQQYFDDLNWLINNLRESFIFCVTVKSTIEESKFNIIHSAAMELYDNLYKIKKKPKLTIVK